MDRLQPTHVANLDRYFSPKEPQAEKAQKLSVYSLKYRLKLFRHLTCPVTNRMIRCWEMLPVPVANSKAFSQFFHDVLAVTSRGSLRKQGRIGEDPSRKLLKPAREYLERRGKLRIGNFLLRDLRRNHRDFVQ